MEDGRPTSHRPSVRAGLATGAEGLEDEDEDGDWRMEGGKPTSPRLSPPIRWAERGNGCPPKFSIGLLNLRSTQNSVCDSAPSGRTQSLMATTLASSLPSGASMIPCSAGTCPCTMARYSFSIERPSRIFPNSPATTGFFATITTPLVSRSRRLTRWGWVRVEGATSPRPSPPSAAEREHCKCSRTRPMRLDISPFLVG